ncbi:hypothetical protein SNEBB_011426 [Seison nebaliae]|nr:hypothetical protein SNEBB_011426 [Seison nebaliae]
MNNRLMKKKKWERKIYLIVSPRIKVNDECCCYEFVGDVTCANKTTYQCSIDDCGCVVGVEEEEILERPTKKEIWGIGLLMVTIINMCSLVGAVLYPLMKMKFYYLFHLPLIGLAIGSLSGTALLHLLPKAYKVSDEDFHFVWKGSTAVVGIYMFYTLERIINIVISVNRIKKSRKDQKTVKKENKENGEVNNDSNINSNSIDMNNTCPTSDHFSMMDNKVTSDVHSKQPHHAHLGNATRGIVAWMIIIGDSLHNTIDGLTIGAAFSQSKSIGINVAVAVICEEFPHELGDFVILLNSGMSVWKAMAFNFMSACFCYLGFVIGAIVGVESEDAATWIFALAGGMFIYISLVNIVPELIHSSEETEERLLQRKCEELQCDVDALTFRQRIWCSLCPYLLQNVGLLTGYIVMILLARFSETIQI